MRFLNRFLFICFSLFLVAHLSNGEILLDAEPIQVGNVILFKDHADEHGYHYMPLSPRIATWPDGTPKFSFLQYVKTGKEVTGGILSFLVTYGLTDRELRDAEGELKRHDEDGKIIGPVPFIQGEFHIISSTAGEGGIFTRKIAGTGKAPLLAGAEAAVSIALNEEGSTFLMESFKRPTSDVSVQFIMTYQGLTPAYEAKLKVNWDKVYEHKEFHAKGGTFFASYRISKIYDDLKETGAIELEVIGEDTSMDALLNTAYSTLAKMMFEAKPVQLSDMGKASGGAGGGKLSSIFSIANVGSYMKKVTMTGEYTVDLRRRKRDQREIPMTGNIGNFYEKYGKNKDIFGVVDLDDPTFQERTIHVILDGEDLETFKEFINFAGITFKKDYEDEDVEPVSNDIVFDRTKFSESGNRLSFTYRRKGDSAERWLEYEYKPIWSYIGGIEADSEWIKTSQPVITLTPPHRYRFIEVLAEEENMTENGIIRVAVQFKHKNFGKEIKKEVVLRKGDPLNIDYFYFHEPNNLEYEYNIMWLLKNGKRISSGWKKATDPFVYAYYEEE
ncbi:MAG: hypothetical protein PVF66_08170 [Candidatus Aminicenantes bacterium]|jgi:hypothetical protein